MKDRIGYIPLGLWLLSLALPSAGWGDGHPALGILILLLGPFGILNKQFGWFANFAFLIAIPINIRWSNPSIFVRMCIIAGIGSTTLQALSWKNVQTDTGTFQVFVGPGFYLWVIAMFAQILCLLNKPSADPSPGSEF